MSPGVKSQFGNGERGDAREKYVAVNAVRAAGAQGATVQNSQGELSGKESLNGSDQRGQSRKRGMESEETLKKGLSPRRKLRRRSRRISGASYGMM